MTDVKMEKGKTETQQSKLVEELRQVVATRDTLGQLESALFWAAHLVTLSNSEPRDVVTLAQLLFKDGQYERASHVVRVVGLVDVDLKAALVSAKADFAAGNAHRSLDTLEGQAIRMIKEMKSKANNDVTDGRSVDTERQVIEASVYCLRGHVLEHLENYPLAQESFQLALQCDPLCSDAFQALIRHRRLSHKEERTLVDNLKLNDEQSCLNQLIKLTYECRLSCNETLDELVTSTNEQILNFVNNDLEIKVQRADRHFYHCDFKLCLKITESVLRTDPYHSSCLPLHISCLVELGRCHPLFHLSHKLIDAFPMSALAWYAVGCYYLITNSYELSRRYLSKATQLNKLFGPAWIAYGHAFALENEHDQAMAAYFKASNIVKGSHLPKLYVGVEYSVTNNVDLAERFFKDALALAPEDPFILNELAVLHYRQQQFDRASEYLSCALSYIHRVCSHPLSPTWEPLLNNLGHVARKLGRYSEALDLHKEALSLNPSSGQTHAAIGYVMALRGEFSSAVEWLHRALALRIDDTFSSTVLKTVLELMLHEQPAFILGPLDDHGADEEVKIPPIPDKITIKEVSNSSLDVDMADVTDL